MIATYSNDNLVKDYWNSIKNAPVYIKLKLISLLTESLEGTFSVNNKKNEGDKIALLREIAGSWDGPEMAEDIIGCIREKRTSRTPITLRKRILNIF